MRVVERWFAVLTMALVVAIVAAFLCGCETTSIAAEQPTATTVAGTEASSTPAEILSWSKVQDTLRTGLADWELRDLEIWTIATNIMADSEFSGADPVESAQGVVELAEVVSEMQPGFGEGREGGYGRALHIAADIYQESGRVRGQCEEAESYTVPDINPFIVAAMGRRESSFLAVTERGFSVHRGVKNQDCRWCKGSLGERGMFQLMPGGEAERLMGDNCDVFDRRCNIRGAVRYLAHVRCECIKAFGSRTTIDTWVAAYGRKEMLSPREARDASEVKVARNYLCSARSDCDSLWPR